MDTQKDVSGVKTGLKVTGENVYEITHISKLRHYEITMKKDNNLLHLPNKWVGK